MEAQEWCRKYQRSSNVKDLTQAWDLYYHVFRRISKQLPQVRAASGPFAFTTCRRVALITSILKPCPWSVNVSLKLQLRADVTVIVGTSVTVRTSVTVHASVGSVL